MKDVTLSSARTHTTDRRAGSPRQGGPADFKPRDIPWWFLWWSSTRSTLDEIDVRALESGAKADLVFAAAKAALSLIRNTDGVRIHKLRRDLRGILFDTTGGASYHPRLRVCCIGIDYALRVPPLELAMTIVHESTHARLLGLGCGYAPDEREHVERACVAAEIAFARKVPGSEVAVDKAAVLLERRWWTKDAQISQARAELKRLGLPQWLIKLVT